jgi:hypothetical protein
MTNFTGLHKELHPNTISMTFKGSVTFELIDSIILVISDRLEQIEKNINTRKKVFGVLIECLQNLGNHVELVDNGVTCPEYDTNTVMFMIDTVEDGYNIVTANFVPKDKMYKLKGWMDEIKQLSKEELRKKYNEILQNNTYNSKGGGGLGFLDIALKVGQNLSYHFHQINDDFFFFTFQITVKKA